VTRLWWVRHGPTHLKSMVGWSDPPADLTDQDAVQRLAQFLPAAASVVSSDLLRARATADAIAGPRQRLPDTPDLREINFGDWELKTFADVDEVQPDLIRDFLENPGDVRAPDGESWNQVRTRVDRSVDTLINLHRGHDLILVAHFGVILSQLQRARDISANAAFAHKIDNLSVTRMEFDGAWVVDLINHVP